MEKIPVKHTTWHIHFLRSYCIHKSFDLGLHWKFKKVTQRSASNLAEILLRRTSLPVKLQHDAVVSHYHIHKELQDVAIWTWPRTKVNIELGWEFDVENISVKLRNDTGNSCSYLVHKAAWPWASSKVQKGDTKVNVELVWDFLCREHPYKFTTWYMQSTKSYHVHKVLPDAACWKFKKVTYIGQDQTWLEFWWVEHHSLYNYNMMQANSDALSYSEEAARCCHLNMTYFKRSRRSDKGQHRTHPIFDVETISVKLRNDTGNSFRIIVFTMQLDIELVWKFKKVTQRSTSNLSEILMYRIPLSSYNLIQAIYEELSHSQGPATCCVLESLKRSYKGQDQILLKFWWVEDHSLYNYNMMQANSDALSYSQGAARCCHLNMTYFKRSDKGQHRTRPRFWCGEYLYKIKKWYRQFLQSYHVHKAAWPWASSKV